MILQSLCRYYERSDELAPEGFEYKEIPFVIVLNVDGSFAQLEDKRKQDGKKKIGGKRALVPKDCGRTSGVKANLMWDKPDYLLGYTASTETEKNTATIIKRHQAFIEEIDKTFPADFQDEGLQAARIFLKNGDFSSVFNSDVWTEVLNHTGAVLSFQLLDDAKDLVCERQWVRNYIENRLSETESAYSGFCLLSGKERPLVRIHPMIKGVLGSQSSGASLVSFNASAFVSYGKENALNAPISQSAAFEYTTALNHLLRKDSTQKINLGDATVVFWASEPTIVEELLPFAFGWEDKDDPEKGTNAVKTFFGSPWKGKLLVDEEKASQNQFFILGLSPNAARLSVRFLESFTVAELSERVRQYFDDLKMTHGEHYNGHISLIRLLQSIAIQEKRDNIPPLLEAATLKAIFSGKAFPSTLLSAAIQRNKASQEVSYVRASIIKACLNRRFRYGLLTDVMEKELTMALDETNSNPAYCLGRLFAVLEKIQTRASDRDLNRTIGSAYYASASSRPAVVFPLLIRQNKHHLKKMDIRNAIWHEKTYIQPIMEHLDGKFPTSFSLEKQGCFSIGYYHQKQAFFQKKESTTLAFV